MHRERVGLGLSLLTLVVWSATGCDMLGPEDRGGPGTITVSVVSPFGAEGSAVLELKGGTALGTVSPLEGEVFYLHRESSSRVVVVLDSPGDIGFLVRTEDVGNPPEASLIQVAGPSDELRSSLEDYEVRITKKRDQGKLGGRG